jgi:hypothetical protein
LLANQRKLLRGLAARAGIEPAHKGFAVLTATRNPLTKQGISAGFGLPKGVVLAPFGTLLATIMATMNHPRRKHLVHQVSRFFLPRRPSRHLECRHSASSLELGQIRIHCFSGEVPFVEWVGVEPDICTENTQVTETENVWNLPNSTIGSFANQLRTNGSENSRTSNSYSFQSVPRTCEEFFTVYPPLTAIG